MVKSRFHWLRLGSLERSTWFNLSQQTCCNGLFPGKTYLAVSLIYTGQVDLGDEGNLRRDVGVVFAAADLQTVDAVLVYAL
jgi:hypothetical protein